MTFVSKLAMAAALTLVAGALGSVPAAAQNAPELKVSKEYQAAAALADAAVKANNIAAAETQIAATEALAKNEDERYYIALLRLQLETLKRNEAGQIVALDALAANPKSPPERVAAYRQISAYLKGAQLIAAKKPAEAIPQLLQARQLGSTQADLPVLLANAYSQTGKNAEALAEVNTAIESSKAAGRKPPQDWYKFAIPRANKSGDRAAMASWLTRYMQDYPSAENWRWAVLVFGEGAGTAANRNERVSLYRLMRATNVLAGRSDYHAYSYLVQSAGLPWEATSVIDEGRKSGKIPAGDAEIQRTYATAQGQAKAEGSLETLAKTAAAAKDGKSAKQTADAFLASGNNARALELYDVSLTKGGVDTDEVNLNRGIALRALGRKDEAKTAFNTVKAGPYSNVALLWATSIDFPPLG